jgi:Zn-dependent protease
MNLGAEQIRWIFIQVFVLVVSVAFHEFGHALVAYKLGDDTPKRQGRVTLNPIAHIDLIGTILLPLAGGVHAAAGGHGGGGFGWGKPVEHNPRNYRRNISMGLGRILVSAAGPSMNLVLAILLAVIHWILVSQGVIVWDHIVQTEQGMFRELGPVSQILAFAVGTNFLLMFFNLLPIPPLDGGHIAEYFVPYRHRDKFDSYARYGPFVVLAVALIPVLAQVFLIPAGFCTSHLYGLFGLHY